MSDPQMYKLYAANCMELAQESCDPDRKATLIAMAQAWLDLTERTERTASARQQQQQPQPEPTE
jgi:hypothetical protein